jgi:hypothetical protein
LKEEIISKPELQLLINLLQRSELNVSYPLYGNFPLLKAWVEDDGYKIKVLANEGDFSRVLRDKREYIYDLPTYRDFHECFLAAGILQYANIDEFLERLEGYKSLTKGIIFAPDTNLLYHAFISNFKPLKGYEIVIVDTVKKEIENAMNFKYKPSQLKELRRILHNYELLNEFSNRRMKKSRKAAYIALREFEKLKSRSIEVESIKEETHTNDELIVKTLKKFDKDTPTLTVLLTADIVMTDIAKLEGIEYFLFEYPHKKLDELFATPYQLRSLLFNLATVFGVVEVNKVLIFGEFGGKVKLNELKLRFHRGGLYEEHKFHLNICREIIKLGIER